MFSDEEHHADGHDPDGCEGCLHTCLHEPMELTWIVEDGKGRNLTSMKRTTTPRTRFLEITLSGKDLFICATWTQSPKGHFYICPAHDSDEKSCGFSDFFVHLWL